MKEGDLYLKIIGEDIDASKDVDGEGIRLDWEEWDTLVEGSCPDIVTIGSTMKELRYN